MGRARTARRPRFTVPETWRPIVKTERQGAGRYDVLACGHAVPVSDTVGRKFRACPDCRVQVQLLADQYARQSRAA